MLSTKEMPASAEAQPPANWPPGDQVMYVSIDLHVCKRIHFGSFERGPITVLTEYHSNYGEIPMACRTGAYDYSSVLSMLWIDDKEIANALASMGIPTKFAAFNISVNPAPAGMETWQASFGTEDASASELLITGIPGEGTTSVSTTRLFWTNHLGGISFMNFALEYTYNGQNFVPIIQGKFQRPFLYATFLGDPLVAHTGGFYAPGSVAAPISSFEDSSCEKPL